MRNMTTQQIIREMGIGINLGNTFEACGEHILKKAPYAPASFFTAWGSPPVSAPMIRGYKEAGFGVLRIPVAWSNMMDASYTIHPDYLAAVRQAVDWALEAGLYVILNIHWDGGWFSRFPAEQARCMEKYTRIWQQLCAAFQSYDDHLMLESLNEEGGWDSLWDRYGPVTPGKKQSYDLLNALNQRFVDIVRSSQGKNPLRHLLIAGYNTDIALTCDPLFRMPRDPAGRCALSVHYYDPAPFALLTQDADWAKARTDWGSEEDLEHLNQRMDMMKTHFVDRGIPVIVGEYGCAKENKDPQILRLYLSTVCRQIKARGMCPILWDTPFQHYHRTQFKLIDEGLGEELLRIREETPPL